MLKDPTDDIQHLYGDSLVPSGNKPLPEPMLTKVHDNLRNCQATVS